MSNASLSFFPYSRSGFRNSIELGDPNSPYIQENVELRLPNQLSASIDFAVFGAGEIIGIDKNQIRRTYPAPGIADTENNYFPFLEFYQSDLPWRYSPELKTGQRLKPWIALIALTEDEFTGFPFDPDLKSLAGVTVNEEFLPDLSQSWAWSHVQVVGLRENESINEDTEAFLNRSISRVMCPRYLQPETKYHVFLVPTYERGRLKGLRELKVQERDISAIQPAWTNQDREIRIPYYHRWQFKTGPGGDFESLVRMLLPPISLPADLDIGYHEMDVQNLGWGLPRQTTEKEPQTFYMKGALISPASEDRLAELEQEAIPTDEFEGSFMNLLNQASITVDLGDDEVLLPVSPPLYGQWHAMKNDVDGDDESWFNELNVDLSMRAAAGLGVQVVRESQESLVASAWDQLPNIEQFNRKLKRLQFSLEVSRCMHKKHISSLDTERLLSVSDKVLGKMSLPGTNGNIQSVLAENHIPKEATSMRLQKLTRKSGSVYKRMKMNRLSANPKLSIFTRLYSGDIKIDQSPFGIAIPNRPIVGLFSGEEAPDSYPLPQINTPIIRPADFDDLESNIKAQLDPERTVLQESLNRISIPNSSDWQQEREEIPPLEPILEAPSLNQAMYAGLRDLSPDWLLPGILKIPNNTLTLLKVNQKFIESYMVGLNHEMSRELLWREYPTDQRGTYFKHFWSSSFRANHQGATVTTPEDLHDIKPIHTWQETALGNNASRNMSSNDLIVFLIRGDLLHRYPNTIIFAQKAILDPENNRIPSDEKRYPIFRGFISPDIHFLGFELSEEDVKGQSNVDQPENQGWFFVFKEHTSEPRFGLDLNPESIGQAVQNIDNMSWHHLVNSESELSSFRYVDLTSELPNRESGNLPGGIPWKVDEDVNATDIAFITYQNPFMAAIHGSDMLP